MNPIAPGNRMAVHCNPHDAVPEVRIDVDGLSMDDIPAALLSGQDTSKICCNKTLGCSFSNPLQLALDGKYADLVFAPPMPEQAVVQNQVHVVVDPQPVPPAANDGVVNMQFFGVVLTLLSVPGLLWLARSLWVYFP